MTANTATGFEKAKVVAYYFAYGSNMNAARVKKRAMPFVATLAGTLQDYQLVFNKRSTIYPGAASANVEQRAGQRVEGVLYQLVDEHSIREMDPFEGYPIRYDRFLLPMQTAKGVIQAWTYVANADYIQAGLQPARWYLSHLLEGKPYLSSAYFEQLSRTQCLPDSDIEP